MVVSPAPALQDIITRLGNVERQLDRLASARVLSAPIGNADIAAAAQIDPSKLNAGGNANRALGTNNGTTAVWGQIPGDWMAAQAVTRMVATSISTGPYFATGAPDNLVWGGSGAPTLTTGPGTSCQYMVFFCFLRLLTNTNAASPVVYAGWNGNIQAEMGYITEAVANYWITYFGMFFIAPSPSTAYSMNIWVLTGNGQLVTLGNGVGTILELKR